MKKQLVSAAAALVLGAFALVGTAQATGDNKPWGGGFKNYGQCLKTKPIKFDGTIVEAALATPELSILADLVVTAGLVDDLSQPGNLTVFAPTDAAFLAIPPDQLDAIGGDTDVLTSVLTYHVVGGPVDPRRSIIIRKVPTLQGQNLFLSYNKNPQINQSNTSCQGIRTSNGTVWVIDSVLMPQYVQMP